MESIYKYLRVRYTTIKYSTNVQFTNANMHLFHCLLRLDHCLLDVAYVEEEGEPYAQRPDRYHLCPPTHAYHDF